MNDPTILGLRAALEHSPDNLPLRLLLADTLLSMQRMDEAEIEYNYILKQHDELKAKMGLAKVFFHREQYAACNVLLESLLENGVAQADVWALHAKALLRENALEKAIAAYQNALRLEPNFFDEELDQQLRVRSTASPEEDPFESFDSRFLQKPSVNFSHVGGMDAVKREIELKIIKPLQHPELYRAYGKKTGGGILLYGPPGCGKTFIAKATAGQINAKFINVGLTDILDMWIGNSEKNLHQIFEMARKNAPCVLFIDEIDALGASRSDMKQSAGRHLINQFLQELDGIEHSNEGVLILGATNTPWHLDPAFRRPGRFDRIIFVPPPDEVGRAAILQIKMQNKPIGHLDYRQMAQRSEHFSGADLEAVIDLAIEDKLAAAFREGVPQPLEQVDLLNAIKRHKPSTQEWFATARNFALFANDSGLYDDILHYLKLKK
jgi:transitional endoplasmic reticulum ATPase